MTIFVFTLQSQLQKLPNCHQLLLTSGFLRTEFAQKACSAQPQEHCGWVTLMSASVPNHFTSLQNHTECTSSFTFPTEFPIHKTCSRLSCKIHQQEKKKKACWVPLNVSNIWVLVVFCLFVLIELSSSLQFLLVTESRQDQNSKTNCKQKFCCYIRPLLLLKYKALVISDFLLQVLPEHAFLWKKKCWLSIVWQALS